MLKKIASIIVATVPLFVLTVSPVFAWQDVLDQITNFPSCLNPQATASQVNTGNDHGVVGFSGAFSGTDTIYPVSGGNTLQCLCTDSGEGFQTEWVKASTLNDDEIKIMENQGWTYYADAGAWGLKGAYIAKSSKFECSKPSPTPTPTPSCSPTPTPTPGPTSTPGPTATPTQGPANTPTPQPSVLGLASTGNISIIYLLIFAGVASLISGIILRKLSK